MQIVVAGGMSALAWIGLKLCSNIVGNGRRRNLHSIADACLNWEAVVLDLKCVIIGKDLLPTPI